MLKSYMADLHIHTCLSPCGSLEMTPQKIVSQALNKKLDIIGICDHNSAENLFAIMNVGEKNNLLVIPGMEICSSEEVHALALFKELESALEMQTIVYENLEGKNDPDIFGMQVIGNENDEVEGFVDKLLIGAVDLSIDELVNKIHKLGGLAVASHIDRESYSIIGQLGFIPGYLKFDALEISPNLNYDESRKQFSEYSDYSLIKNSDAHFLRDIGKCTTEFFIEQPSFEEIKKAFSRIDGRKVIIN